MRTFLQLTAYLALLCCGVRCCTAAEQAGEYELRIFNVADICQSATDFPAPGLSLHSNSGVIVDPFAGQSVSPTFKPPDLVTLIHDRMLAAQFVDPATSIAENNGQLVVMQRKEVHQKIAQFLSEMRAVAKEQIAFKGVLVPATEVPAATVLDADAFARLLGPQGAGGATAAPRVVCFNGQLAHTRSGKTFNYIRDYDAAGAVYDPVIGTALDGYTCEVRPQLSSDGAYAVVNLRFSFGARTGNMETRSIVLAPPAAPAALSTKAKSAELGPVGPIGPTGAPAMHGVTLPIDVPSMSVQSINTCLRVPLGKWMLAGVMDNPNPDAKEKRMLFLISVEKLTAPRAP